MDKDHSTQIDWVKELTDQQKWNWAQLRPRLEGLTDEEYFWEPVRACWTLSRRGQSDAPVSVGAGDFTLDYAMDQLDPSPVTTIAWRLAHIIVGLFAMRTAMHFDGPPADYRRWTYAPTAKEALDQLDQTHDAWTSAVRGLRDEDLARCIGPGEGLDADYPFAALILHVNREAIHHGAEIALLRDLYAWKADAGRRLA
jgi:hypothetical protein